MKTKTKIKYDLVNLFKIFLIAHLLTFTVNSLAITIEKTFNLNVYYPEYTKIDLVCGQMPKTTQSDVVFCCEAAFTGKQLTKFEHMNIADNHICNGEMKKGYSCSANSGGFVWGDGKWEFMLKSDFPDSANNLNMGFCQILIIKDGIAEPAKRKNNKNIYRALCEKNGKLCIIESNKVMTYTFFVECLKAYKVTHALYLDMGSGWNYAWYRDDNERIVELHTRTHNYCTNWITFYK